MIQYVCDYCTAVKNPDDVWILGFAVESRGITAARREFTMAPVWDERRARDWLAVHFCCEQCKDNYMAELFGVAPAESEITNTVEVVRPNAPKAKVLTMTKRQRTASKSIVSAPRRKRS
jgi:hypothetical protein